MLSIIIYKAKKITTLLLFIFISLAGNAQDSTKKEQVDSAWIKWQQYVEFMIHNDWPTLSRYKDANAALGAPAANEKRVVFMGNSITEGWLNADSSFFTKHKYIDRGIGGQTTPQMLVRFRPDVIDLKPKVVVILAGTNDIAGNTGPSTLKMIQDNLASMAELAKAHNIEVILCSVLPVYDYPWKKGLQPAEKIVALNAWLKQYANENGFTYVDYWTPMADERKGMKTGLANDGVHPTLEGYKVMESIVQPAIEKALTK